jgi:hypothetical protein
MNRQVEGMARSLDVKAAQEHMRRITGNSFVAAPSEVTVGRTRAMKTR